MAKRELIKEMTSIQDVSWLAGLLEAEGSFILCGNGQIRLSLQMTDLDVVTHAANLMGSKVFTCSTRQAHHKTPYSTKVCGERAAYYMQRVLPYMGLRRSASILAALSRISESIQTRKELRQLSAKISDSDLLAAWEHWDKAKSFREFARTLGLTHQSLGRRLQALTAHVKVEPNDELEELDSAAWLAGLFEGEGWFGKTGASIALSLKMTDEDVVRRAATLLDTAYREDQPEKAGWKPTYRFFVRGDKGISVMKKLRPFMGQRRTKRIDECIAMHDQRVCNRELKLRKRHDDTQVWLSKWAARTSADTVYSIARDLGVHPATLRRCLISAKLYIPNEYARVSGQSTPASTELRHDNCKLAA